MISVEEALARILEHALPLGREQVMLAGARGRVLAEDIVSSRMLPPWDNSAMDGYAVRAAECPDGAVLPIAFTVGAGRTPEPLPPGAAARIMTGAPVPAGADAVVMREHAGEEPGFEGAATQVRFRRQPRPGDHIRGAGEDVAKGATVLAAGTVVGAGEIGLCAGLGRSIVSVYRRPQVAILSTGDELVEPDRQPGPGQIVGSNSWALAAQCEEAGALPTVLPIARDDRGVIRSALAEALRADVAISTGGVSVGAFDFVKEALGDLGVEQSFWRVAMKPGKPIAFGTHGGRPVFGLPGNPASSMVAFELFVRPALRRLAGHAEPMRPRALALLDEAYAHEGGRRHFLRARVRRDGAVLRVRANTRQGSGMLRSMVGVNALIEIPETAGRLDAGVQVFVLLFEAV